MIHQKLDDFLNNVPYPVEVPVYALPKPVAVEMGIIEPIFTPNKNEIVLSRITISRMIDFSSRSIPFRIMKSEDILEISAILQEYIRQLKEFEELEEARNYLIKSNKLFNELQRSVNIIAKRDQRAVNLLRRNKLIDLFKTNL